MNDKLILDTLDRLEQIGRESGLRAGSGSVPIPSRTEAVKWIKDIQALLFPGYFALQEAGDGALSQEARLSRIRYALRALLESAFVYDCCGRSGDAAQMTDEFIARLPDIKRMLCTDIEALYEGDPAARCREEVLICYPGFFAVSVYRVAHVLYEMNVPFLPRMLTEYAHERTGVDIHAGAQIGEYFFIDHGTGIVVGETTVIGDHVKLYQGVTLGAKSFELDEHGNPVKGIKRHPNIGSHVVVYANATILGGRTTIGDGCTIGANVWITKSVEPGQTVYFQPAAPASKGQ
ncbi:MAG: serine O-acetyltransferase EpsC [Eubacteriales bacterium]|nr:serine O-acetyltransferase EpsC [Eubacteriales bacterium]